MINKIGGSWLWLIAGLAISLILACSGGSPKLSTDYHGTELGGQAPDFRLLDQNAATVALSNFQGKVVALAFLDPECTDICPLTANQFRLAAEKLGENALQVAFLAVNVNPQKNSLADVAEATSKWGMQSLPNWHYLTSSREELEPVYQSYTGLAEGPSKPGKPSEREHSPGVYVIDQTSQKRWYISTNFEGAPALNELLVKHTLALLR